jgi:hypothetical protein
MKSFDVQAIPGDIAGAKAGYFGGEDIDMIIRGVVSFP